jgi:hypothetical protein
VLDDGYDTPGSLGAYLVCEPDLLVSLRVASHQIYRWFNTGLTPAEVRQLTALPPNSGSRKFDALIEGLTCLHFMRNSMEPPSWVFTTKLNTPWFPYNEVTKDDRYYLAAIIFTPPVLLQKGIIYDRKDLEIY